MGFRTLVLLHNDRTSEWEKDPELGRKIMIGMNHTHDKDHFGPANLDYGRVVECTHADTQTLAVIDSYHFDALAHGHWHQGQTHEQRDLALLKQLAAKMGYSLRKNPVK